jgi:TRAP transporter 4TM/12TM fusion protein
MPGPSAQPPVDAVVAPAIEEIESEGRARAITGWPARIAGGLALAVSLYALYWVVGIVQPQIYRVSFLLLSLVLIFLLFRGTGRGAAVTPLDWLLCALSVVALAWPIVDFDRFVYRAATPLAIDVALGAVTIVLVLEAARRTVGLILPVTAIVFLAYGYYGPLLDRLGLSLIGHRGYPIDRLVATLYMTLEGIFGVPVDVAATYIVLFVIYGVVLERSGAGRFFVDWAMAAIGRFGGGAGPGRTVAVAGYLLGCVSGSGVANTVTLGAVAWPMLRRSGYTPEIGGAILAAAGIGAILAPPAMGAAAFLIAEFLSISFLQVIAMAAIPAALYYASILLMIEMESRKLGTTTVDVARGTLGRLTRQYGYHFISISSLAFFIIRGMTAVRAVFWATLLAIGLSFIRKETALWPARLASALAAAGRSVVPVVATTAVAGIIVGVVTLTGLGLKVSGLIVALAGGSVFLTVVYAAVAVWVLGLAVPVTASYIIAAVMIAPALVQVGIPAPAAHMFIFYYAVLSEVSPPTALSPFAAAALTKADPMQTTIQTWKYTLPAFVVPFMFTLSDRGRGLLLQAPWTDVVVGVAVAALSLACFAAGICGWMLREASLLERAAAIACGALLISGSMAVVAVAAVGLAATLGVHVVRVRGAAMRI